MTSGFNSRTGFLLPALPWLGLAALWTGLTATLNGNSPILDPLFVASPAATIRALGEGLLGHSHGLVQATLQTVLRSVAAAILAAAIGVPVGLIVGGFERARLILLSFVDGLRSLPATALFPLFLLSFGAGDASKIAVATYVSLWATAVFVAGGIKSASSLRLWLLRQHRVRISQVVVDGLLMPAIPHVVTALRTSISLSLVLIIGVEMIIGARNGLGQYIYVAQATFDIPGMYAALVMAAIVGLTFNVIFDRMVRWFPWN